MPGSLKTFEGFDALLCAAAGLIASRELDTYPVASKLYAPASHVIYWGEPKP